MFHPGQTMENEGREEPGARVYLVALQCVRFPHVFLGWPCDKPLPQLGVVSEMHIQPEPVIPGDVLHDFFFLE